MRLNNQHREALLEEMSKREPLRGILQQKEITLAHKAYDLAYGERQLETLKLMANEGWARKLKSVRVFAAGRDYILFLGTKKLFPFAAGTWGTPDRHLDLIPGKPAHDEFLLEIERHDEWRAEAVIELDELASAAQSILSGIRTSKQLKEQQSDIYAIFADLYPEAG